MSAVLLVSSVTFVFTGNQVHEEKCLRIDEKGTGIYCFAVQPKNEILAYVGENNEVVLFNLKEDRAKSTFKYGASSVYSIALSPEGRIAVGKAAGEIDIRDCDQGKIHANLKGSVAIERLQFSDDGKHLVVAGWHLTKEKPGMVEVWDTGTNGRVHGVETKSLVHPLAMCPSSSQFAVGELSGLVSVFDLKHPDDSWSFQAHPSEVRSLAFSPKAGLLATGGRDAAIKIWDMKIRKLVRTTEKQKSPVGNLVFSKDGKLLVSSDYDTIRYWNVATGREVFSFKAHTKLIRQLAFNDNRLLTASLDGTLKLWNAQKLQAQTRTD